MRKIYIPTELMEKVDFDTETSMEFDPSYGFAKYKIDYAMIQVYLHHDTQAYKDWLEHNYSIDTNGRLSRGEKRDYVMFYKGRYLRFRGLLSGDMIFSTENTWESSDIHETMEEKVERLEKEIESLKKEKKQNNEKD